MKGFERIALRVAAGVAVAASFALAGEPSGDAHDVYGVWYTPDRDSVIRIADCGDGTPCGTVTWLDENRAQVLIDEHNRDASLRGRPILGIRLLGGFEAGERGWRGGEIYHPGNGNTYSARVRRLDADTLEVKGCVGPVCRGQSWSRAEEGLAALNAE